MRLIVDKYKDTLVQKYGVSSFPIEYMYISF